MKEIYSLVTAALIICLCATFSACELSSAEDEEEIASGVLVANQGNFSEGNGSITLYDPQSQRTTTIAADIGSIIQSIAVRDERVFVASNTGNRIDAFEIATGQQVLQIDDVPSPRYMAFYGDGAMAVTNLFDNSISVIDVAASRKASVIGVGANPEGITVHGMTAYVSNHGFGAADSISVVDLATGTVKSTIKTECHGPRFTFLDRQTELWVVCTGQVLYDQDFNVLGRTDARLLIYEASSEQLVAALDLDGMIQTTGPGQDAYYADDIETLFVVVDGSTIRLVDTMTNTWSASIGPLDGAPIGAVAFDASSDILYVARVPGFTVSGSVSTFDLAGNELGSFAAGVAPSHISFFQTSR